MCILTRRSYSVKLVEWCGGRIKKRTPISSFIPIIVSVRTPACFSNLGRRRLLPAVLRVPIFRFAGSSKAAKGLQLRKNPEGS